MLPARRAPPESELIDLVSRVDGRWRLRAVVPFIKKVVDLAAVKMSQPMLLWIASFVVFVLSAGLTFGWCFVRAPRSLMRESPRSGVQIEHRQTSLLRWNRLLDTPNSAPIIQNAQPATSNVQLPVHPIESHVASLSGSFSAMAASTPNGLADPRTTPHLPLAKSLANPTHPVAFKNSGQERVSITLPARPLKEVMPNTRMLGSSLPSASTDVEVEVRIDESGRVTAAHVMNNGSQDNRALENAAVAAAKEWIFEPAKRHGESVPSVHVLEFHFHP